MREMEVLNLSEISRSFATREKAQSVVRSLSEVIEASAAPSVLVDWEGVTVVSPSFVDEFVGGIQQDLLTPGAQVFFTRPIPPILALVDTILRRRGSNIEYLTLPDELR